METIAAVDDPSIDKQFYNELYDSKDSRDQLLAGLIDPDEFERMLQALSSE